MLPYEIEYYNRPKPKEENTEKSISAETALKLIEENAWDLRCESYPLADTGDYSIQWVVYEHHMGKPSNPIGYGETPIKAVIAAEQFVHGKN